MTETLAGYIDWIGGFDFSACPFRDADALVLCVISYFDVSPLFEDGAADIKVADCVRLIENGGAKLMITGGDLGNTEIFEKAVRSKRFGGLRMTDCVNELRNDPPYQFFAVTFENEIFSFAAFRGTDSSLAGWKENFMISFTRTEAQVAAAEYAALAYGKREGRDFYIAGHSKGGNLALFAACMIPEDDLQNVTRVYSLDGPGFCPDVLDPGIMRRIDGITTRIIPEFDFIGKLFEPEISDTKIIKSYRSGMDQHSLASWLVEGGELALEQSNAPRSIALSRLVNEWIGGVSVEERQTLVDELFETLGADGVTDLTQMNSDSMSKTIVRLSKTSETTRSNLKALPRRALFAQSGKHKKKEKNKEGSRIERIVKSKLFSALVLAALGAVLLVTSDRILETLSVILLSAAAAVQFFITVKALFQNRFHLSVMMDRVYITIVLVALIPVVIFKESATFLLGSVIFGLAFLIAAIRSIDAAKKSKGFYRVIGILEAVFFGAVGIGYLVIPKRLVPVFAMSSGIMLAADSAARIIFLIVSAAKRRR